MSAVHTEHHCRVNTSIPAKSLRLCNTHLELPRTSSTLTHPWHIESIAKRLHNSLMYSSFLAGDLNDIEPLDSFLSLNLQFFQCVSLRRGQDGVENGFTREPQF